MDFAAIDWMIVVILLLVFGGSAYWLGTLIPRERLMRCPETGGIALVEADPALAEQEVMRRFAVRACEFWPENRNCGRGCLARYAETAPGFPISVRALTPFERTEGAKQARLFGASRTIG